MSSAPRISRLAPCPCGSGRRFRDCHGRLAPDRVPAETTALNEEGLRRMEARDVEGAKACFGRALQISPESHQVHFNLAHAYLMEGDYARGWQEYEWRTRAPNYADYAAYPFGIPRWKDEPLAGRRLLVHGEQGLGDTIQCARFLSVAAREAASVDLFCQPALVSILGRVNGVARATGTLAEKPDQDFHLPIMDLAAHFLPSADEPHWFGPYIQALPDRAAAWGSLLANLSRPRIGLVWKGSRKNIGDKTRSMAASEIGALVGPRASFVSLQLEADAGELPAGIALDLAPRIADWEDTAAALQHLDLLVSVDTAPAHLAGAMGLPVWLLVRHSSEWRWGLEGESSPWYPSMRLFRQGRAGDWAGVMARVREELPAAP